MTGNGKITYLVTGDIHPCEEVLRNSGRRVRFDAQVDVEAVREIKAARKYVVVAHGNSSGTVFWYSSLRGTSEPWLWMTMKATPKNARVYLYACFAGAKLRRHLKHCECFGHSNTVPIPEQRQNDVILSFLDEVDILMKGDTFDFEVWRSHLGAFVNSSLASLIAGDSFDSTEDFQNTMSLILLRRSLGFPDE